MTGQGSGGVVEDRRPLSLRARRLARVVHEHSRRHNGPLPTPDLATDEVVVATKRDDLTSREDVVLVLQQGLECVLVHRTMGLGRGASRQGRPRHGGRRPDDWGCGVEQAQRD